MNCARLPLAAAICVALTLPAALRAQSAQTTPAATAPNAIYAPLPGLDRGAMDTAADPCADFYRYACGNFSKLHPLPPDRPYFDEITNLREYNTQVLYAILKQAAATHAAPGSDQQKIGGYYASCMDTAAIEKKGLAVLQPQLDEIAALKSKAGLTPLIAREQKLQTGALFEIGSQQDFKNANEEIAVVDQGGLGLPEKDYYLRADNKSVQTRKEYVQHLVNLLKLMGEPTDKAANDAAAVMAFETSLAQASMSAVDRRQPSNMYHVMTVQQLAADLPLLNVPQLLTESGFPPVASANVASPEFFKALQSTLQQTDLETIKTYLRVRLVDSESMRLPKAFDDEHFNFYGRQLLGTLQQQPRYKRCVASTDSALGEVLGKSYVAQYFAGDSKAKTLQLVNQIEVAMREDLNQIAWMSPQTKAKAEEKLSLVANKIGYPAKWRDYSKLLIVSGDAMGNSFRAREFDLAYELNKIGKPVDRNEWEMTPPTVNAYYDPSMNDINFPAGFLQPPFYDRSASSATNFGHIGSVVGHELTHAFDDQGRQFDGHGNLVDWWTASDAKHFEQRTSCLVTQYGDLTAVDSLHVNGKLTLGENTADNGGLRLAFMAFMAQAAADHINLQQKSDGFTPLQRLFLGWAQNWCASTRPAFVRYLVQTDPHSPDRIRANAVLMNMPEFGQAFGCKKGQPMVPAKICRVW